MNRERVKTIILSILVAISVLLTNQIWRFAPIGVIQSEAANDISQQDILEAKNQIISPQKVTVGFGASFPSHLGTVLVYDDAKEVWDLSKLVIASFFLEEPVIRKITKETYIENYLRQYVELEFGENFSSVLVSSVFSKELDNRVVGNIRTIKKILIPAAYKGIVFMVGEDEEIFQLTLDNYGNDLLKDYIKEEIQSKAHSEYRPLFNNKIMFPTNFTTPVPQLFIESLIDVENERSMILKAKGYFDNFDFVKTIKETSGARVYLYGYGEKSLRINPSGRLVYTEDVGNRSSMDVLSALEEAIEFIEKHGGFPDNSYLASVRTIEENRGYLFAFNYFIDGYAMAFHSSNLNYPVEIEVFDDKIRSYRTFTRRKMTLPSIPKQEPILAPFKVIENNIELLTNDYLRVNNLESIESREEILDHIEAVEMVYFDTKEDKRRQILLPTWKIKIKERVYYFDSYKGELLNTNILN
ncbi:two-component system activity regulator YycH [Alkaliphilus serpentinus]|uniref:Regulatory protein YycH domain-containing protein n=1 Tax=Alkaliphilus serpentinus TaxID=1482731 RepID=A0A833M918_9FIRM|nr:two-component system activity regulator YycH [Alkaliphilus serpentinus]KAB3532179.1 hypothetical protein F8153_02675 [Alkaliphilus serpentinus]